MPVSSQTIQAQNRAQLAEFVERYQPLLVLTGAGCSTASGIPAYRDREGNRLHRDPVTYRDFVRSVRVRQRYWARAMTGWRRVLEAKPNPAHDALCRLERAGKVHHIVTQNVDGLHQKAGSRRVLDLHGRLQSVICLDCRVLQGRAAFQEALERHNPTFAGFEAVSAPDGDARLEGVDFDKFVVPACDRCGGTLKPDVVFYGEAVPPHRVEHAFELVNRAAALLVVGSSLMVFSGYRFCRRAWKQQKPVAAINLGHTRADAQLALKIEAPCEEILPQLVLWD